MGGIGADHTGALEYKYVWVVRHDGLLFASGWRISADEYTKFVVDEAIARLHEEGLEATLAYYNSSDSVDAQWCVFIATPEGEVLGHYNAEDFAVHPARNARRRLLYGHRGGRVGEPQGREPRYW